MIVRKEKDWWRTKGQTKIYQGLYSQTEVGMAASKAPQEPLWSHRSAPARHVLNSLQGSQVWGSCSEEPTIKHWDNTDKTSLILNQQACPLSPPNSSGFLNLLNCIWRINPKTVLRKTTSQFARMMMLARQRQRQLLYLPLFLGSPWNTLLGLL